MNLNAIQIKDACKGEFLVEPIDTSVFATCIKIDSRKVECGDMFIAFNGENVDGHDFIGAAIDNKASIIICENKLDDDLIRKARDAEVSIIKVESAQQAVSDISKF